MINPFYNPAEEKQITRSKLPHWSQHGKLHFVTFRLSDSIPQHRLEQIQRERLEWKKNHPLPYTDEQWHEYQSLFSSRIDEWLNAGRGECLLARPEYADIVREALLYYEGQRYYLDYWVIMPNHVHVLLMPLAPYALKGLLHSWKSYTANRFMKLDGRKRQIWQHESFDHIVRSPAQLNRFRKYIVDNHNQSGGKSILSDKAII
ncbi:transposase [Anaerohalosphaeraceae bacterium U12dextr]